jgi:hypothetical protein
MLFGWPEDIGFHEMLLADRCGFLFGFLLGVEGPDADRGSLCSGV